MSNNALVKDIEARILREDQALALIDSLRAHHEQERRDLVAALSVAARLRERVSEVVVASAPEQRARPTLPEPKVAAEEHEITKVLPDPVAEKIVQKVQVQKKPITGRPADLPSNFEMFAAVLREAARPLRAKEILNAVRASFWPGAPENVTTDLYRFVPSRLTKDSEFRFSLRGDPAPAIEHKVERPAPSVPAAPITARPAAPPPDPEQAEGGHEFEQSGKIVRLPTKEWRVANLLFDNMGKGFMPHEAVMTAAFKAERRGAITPSIFIAEMARALNRKLEPMKLKIESFANAGWFMKEVE